MAANCISYALRHDLDFSMPYQTNDNFWNPIYLPHLINEGYIQGREDILINEPHYHYAPIPFQEGWRHKQIVLNGYWQSERFFVDFKKEVITLFNFKWKHIPDVCSIHARFGDYLTIAGKHIIINEDYLTRAMAIIKERTDIERYKVFSDDIPYFKKLLGHLYDFEYSTNTNEVDDLVEMSWCHSHINSSSTFSWWGSYLNKNEDKIIVTPEDWFQKGWMNMNTSDVIPESWIKI
jgi:hypothetical protein